MATTDLERLVVQLSADMRQYERGLKKAQGITNTRLNAIQGRFARMNKTMAAGFAQTGVAAAKAFALVGGAIGAKNLSDAATRIDNALKVAGLSGKELDRVYQSLFQSATKNAAPIETLVTLYGKAALAQKELGVTGQELEVFAGNVALALRVAGTDAQAASGAITQLGQALGSGRVYAEEFQSILEGAPTIAQAAAAGLEEAGGSVSKLKELVVDGKISSEAFFRAFEAGAPMLEEKVSSSVYTIDDRLTNLKNALINAAKEFNESSEAGETFGQAIDDVSRFINGINFNTVISEVQRVIEQLGIGVQAAQNFANALGQISGLQNLGQGLVDMLPGEGASKSFLGGALTVTSTKGITDRINQAFEGEIQRAGELTSQAIKDSVLGRDAPSLPKGGRIPGAPSSGVTPVSLRNFAAPSGGRGGGGGGRRSGGGGGGGGGGGSANELQREIEQIRERTAAIQAETVAMEGLNPLLDDYGFSLEKARAKSDLLTAAQQAGIAITPELEAQIDALAEGYASASSEAEKLAQSQENVRRRAEEFRNIAQEGLGGFVSDLLNGKDAADALADAIGRVTDRLLDMVLNSAFDNLFGGGLGGIFGGSSFTPNTTLGGFLGAASGGRVSGPGSGTSDSIPARLSNGEFVVNSAATRKNLPLLEAINSGKGLHLATGGLVGHRSGGSGNGGVTLVNKVNIVNNSNAKVSQQERQTSTGPTLDILIDETVGKKMTQPGSASNRSLGSFGIKAGLARR